MKPDTRLIKRSPDSGDPIIIWEDKKRGPFRQGMVLDMKACSNPDCRFVHVKAFAVDERCENMKFVGNHFSFDVKKGSSLTHPLPNQQFEVSVDIDSYDLMIEPSLDPSVSDFLAWLSKEVKHNLAETIQRRWRMGKPKKKDQWKKKDWSWWDKEDMLGYDEIFPDEPDFIINKSEKSYWVIDSYCVNPQCKCKNAGLSFIEFSQGLHHDLGSLMVDLRDFSYDVIESNKFSSDALADLFRDFLGEFNIKKKLRLRQKEMKKIGKKLVKLKDKAGTRKPPLTAKVGRNDPCPCGSGKKFKKCCY